MKEVIDKSIATTGFLSGRKWVTDHSGTNWLQLQHGAGDMHTWSCGEGRGKACPGVNRLGSLRPIFGDLHTHVQILDSDLESPFAVSAASASVDRSHCKQLA